MTDRPRSMPSQVIPNRVARVLRARGARELMLAVTLMRAAMVVVCALLALWLALVLAAPAAAHSGAPMSSPASGAVVASLPATVTITFDGRLARVSGVKVLDARGADHATSARLDPRNAKRVVVRTARPVAGSYTVRWQVRSEDGHAQSGTFSFRARR